MPCPSLRPRESAMAKARKPKTAAKANSTTGSSSSATEPPVLPQSSPDDEFFTPRTLDRTLIAIPLLEKMEGAKPDDEFDVIIDVNLEYSGGRSAARNDLWQM